MHILYYILYIIYKIFIIQQRLTLLRAPRGISSTWPCSSVKDSRPSLLETIKKKEDWSNIVC